METYKPNRLLIPEEKLILQSCSNRQDLQDTFFRELLNEVVDWEYFIERSIDTLLAPVIYKRIRELKDLEVEVPAHVITKLHQTYSQIFVKNTFLFNSFHDLLVEFEKREIQVIPLKGIFLLENYYEDFGLRQISDLDLLVRKSELENVIKMFNDLGFSMAMYMPQRAAEAAKISAPYKFTKGDVVVDLHVSLSHGFCGYTIEMNSIWENAHIGRLSNGVGCRYLSTLDHVLFLFIHLRRHIEIRNFKMISFYDILIILQKERLNTNDILRRADDFGCYNEVEEILYLLNKFFSLALDNILEPKKDDSRKKIDSIFLQVLSENRATLEKQYAAPGTTGFKHLSVMGRRDKLIYLFSRVFPDRRYLFSTYGTGSKSLFSCYIYHFKTIFFRLRL
jgi:hypothetical protein